MLQMQQTGAGSPSPCRKAAPLSCEFSRHDQRRQIGGMGKAHGSGVVAEYGSNRVEDVDSSWESGPR
jgi:hypothetical protein